MTALLIVIAVLLLIGLLPAGVKLLYNDGEIEARVKLGPLRIPIMPVKQPRGKKLARQHLKKVRSEQEKRKKRAEKRVRKKKKKEAEKKKPKEQRAAERQAKKAKRLSLEELIQLARVALEAVSRLPRKLAVAELTLCVTYGGRDAAQAAIGYGRAWAMIGTALPVLERALRIRKKDVRAELDYERDSLGLYARLDVHMLVGTAALLAFGTAFRFLRLWIANKMKDKTKKEV